MSHKNQELEKHDRLGLHCSNEQAICLLPVLHPTDAAAALGRGNPTSPFLLPHTKTQIASAHALLQSHHFPLICMPLNELSPSTLGDLALQ